MVECRRAGAIADAVAGLHQFATAVVAAPILALQVLAQKRKVTATVAFHVAMVTLSGCASNPPPLENAYCVVYQRLPDPSDAVNLKKRENKVAILTNEQAYIDFCGPEKSGLTGPR